MDKFIKQRDALKNKYPDHVPVIIKKGNNANLINYNAIQEKYLMSKSLHISQVLSIIRKNDYYARTFISESLK